MDCRIVTTMLLLLSISCKSQTKPNIVFIWYDDLGFADVSYNGGTYPTPVLDSLANTNAIKLNFHYCEALCSPSRSALFTGRYGWKSGLNTVTGENSHRHVSLDTVFYTQLLQNDGYNTFIAGKWHIGYKYKDILPGRRGFDEAIYGHGGSQYYTRVSNPLFTSFDKEFPTANPAVINKRDALFPDGRLPVHDAWGIDANTGDDVPILVGDTRYNEEIYTEGIIDFISRQNTSNPFYVHYSLFTPHSSIAEPPALSEDFDYDYTICDVDGLSEDKKLFCRAVLYAQEKIEQIINKIKDTGFWDNTLILIASDNGPEPESGGVTAGQTLPLRGIKSSVNDGGLRTPAFLTGGYIENMLNELGTTYCEYDEMVHISDWYNIFTEIAGITHNNSDSDHIDLEILDDIMCKCDALCIGSAEDDAIFRDELISMRLCGDDSDYTVDYPEKTFYSAMIIKKPWKLIVNGSYPVNDGCPNNEKYSGLSEKNTWTGYDKQYYTIPNQTFFDDWYDPTVSNITSATRDRLYKSQCLDALNGTTYINDDSYSRFQYGEFMLFNIVEDKIEACNVGEEMDQQNKVAELWAELQLRSKEYNVPQSIEPSVGSLWAQVNSYDCDKGVTYAVPWEGLMEGKCGDPAQTDNDIEARECRDIWRRLNNLKEACNQT